MEGEELVISSLAFPLTLCVRTLANVDDVAIEVLWITHREFHGIGIVEDVITFLTFVILLVDIRLYDRGTIISWSVMLSLLLRDCFHHF